jgi:Holliday junction resolvase RusA-like endonuclease
MEAFWGKNWRQKLDSAYDEIALLLKFRASKPEVRNVVFYEGYLPDGLKHVAVWSTDARFRDLIVEKLIDEGVCAKAHDQSGNAFHGFTVDFGPLTT